MTISLDSSLVRAPDLLCKGPTSISSPVTFSPLYTFLMFALHVLLFLSFNTTFGTVAYAWNCK
jgi:hypothetical protein